MWLVIAACGTPAPTTPHVAGDVQFTFGRLGRAEDWHLPDTASIEVTDVDHFKRLLRDPAPKSIEIWDVPYNPKQQAVVCAEVSQIAVTRLAVYVPFTSRPTSQLVDCLARLPIEYLTLQAPADLDLAVLLAKLPRLRGLQLQTYQRTDAPLPATALEELRFGDLGGTPATTSFGEWVAAQPKLTTLVIQGKQAWTPDELQPLSHLTGLLSLRLDVDAPGDAIASVIAAMPALVSVDVGYAANDAVAEAISRGSAIEAVRLTDNQMTDAGFGSIARIGRLKHLTLISPTFSDHAMTGLQGLRQLTTLTLYSLRESMKQSMRALAPLSKLEELDLRGTTVDVQELAGLAELKALRTLSLGVASCEGLAAIGTLANLRQLDVATEPRCLAKLGALHALATLHVDDGANALTPPKPIVATAGDLAALADLSIVDLQLGLVDDGAAVVLAKMKALRVLVVRGSHLEEHGLRTLMASRSIQTLGLGSDIRGALADTVLSARCGNAEMHVSFCGDPNAAIPCSGHRTCP